jgi:hypothetical protein
MEDQRKFPEEEHTHLDHVVELESMTCLGWKARNNWHYEQEEFGEAQHVLVTIPYFHFQHEQDKSDRTVSEIVDANNYQKAMVIEVVRIFHYHQGVSQQVPFHFPF